MKRKYKFKFRKNLVNGISNKDLSVMLVKVLDAYPEVEPIKVALMNAVVDSYIIVKAPSKKVFKSMSLDLICLFGSYIKDIRF